MPKEHKLIITLSNPQAVSVQGRARAALGKGKDWFYKFLVGVVPQRGHPGKYAIVERFMKRRGFGNWYSETVQDQQTGEVLRHCEEPLDQHQGHGSAKTHNQVGPDLRRV